MDKPIEDKVAQTILQQPEEVKVGDKTYIIAPPSVATLILISGAVARLPHIRLDENKIVEGALSIAKDCRELGTIAATLILGAKHVNDIEIITQTVREKRCWGLFHTKRQVVTTETKCERLSRELLEEMTPANLYNLVARTLAKMQVGDFFGLTTFLTEINLMQPTKVVTEATASGQ